MKKIKYICCLALFLYGFLLNGEMYVTDLPGNTTFSMIEISTYEDDVLQMLAALEQAAQEAGCELIETHRVTIAEGNSRLTVYVTEGSMEMLQEDFPLTEGEFWGVNSGTVAVDIRPFSELAELGRTTFSPMVLGDELEADEEVVQDPLTGSLAHAVGKAKFIVNDMKELGYACSQLALPQENTSEKSSLLVLWSAVALILLILTWFDMQFSKKENFVLLSVGKTVGQLILRDVVKDTVMYITIYLGLHFGLGLFTYTGYTFDYAPIFWTVFLLLNAGIYLHMLRYDYKEVMYGAHIKKSLLKACIVLNMVITTLIVNVLGSLVPQIHENIKPLLNLAKLEQLDEEGYGYFSVELDYKASQDINAYEYMMATVMYDCLQHGKAAVATNVLGNVTIYDENTKHLLGHEELFENLDTSCEMTILLPEGTELTEQDWESMLRHICWNYGQTEYEPTYEVRTYRQKLSGLHVGASTSGIGFGFAEEKNPIIVYIHSAEQMLSEPFVVENMRAYDALVRLRAEDIAELEEKYAADGLAKITFTGLLEYNETYRVAFFQQVLIHSIICIFTLIMNLLAINVILKLEYAIYGKTLALRAVFGDTVWEKNAGLLKLNVIAGLSGFLVLTAINLIKNSEYLWRNIYQLTEKSPLLAWLRDSIPWNMIPYVLVLVAINMIFMYLRILKIDKNGTVKLLKGGTL